jgi:hypothetical protein
MPSPRLGAGGLTGRAFVVSATCIVGAQALILASHFTSHELSLDEAVTFFVSAMRWRSVITVPITFQSQPPLFYLALHGWIRLGDHETVLRALPALFMAAAALTVLCASSLTPLARVIAVALLLLSPYGEYLTRLIRPYSLSVWLSLGSCLLFTRLLTGSRIRVGSYAAYIAVTTLMAYSLAMTAWVLVAEGACAAVAIGLEGRRSGARRTVERHGALLWSLAIVAALYLPFVIAVWHYQGGVGESSIRATLADAINPRYFVSGPLYLLAMPYGFGYLAAAAAAWGVWIGFRRRDPLVGVLLVVVLAQISLTHGFLAGRSGFGFRYLAPAFPALCLLVALGADHALSRVPVAGTAVAACAVGLLIAAGVSFARAPRAAPLLPWELIRADFTTLPGIKEMFFEIGWDAQPLRYELRHDPEVRMMVDAGSGWLLFGQPMTAAYVTRTVDRDVAPAETMFFYAFDPVTDGRVFHQAFEPAMARHHCFRTYEREIPTATRSVPGGLGALLYGYVCHAR